jgi:hypothetical protein
VSLTSIVAIVVVIALLVVGGLGYLLDRSAGSGEGP